MMLYYSRCGVIPVRCETRVFSSVMLGYCGAIPARCETRVFSSVMLLFSLWCDTSPKRDNGVRFGSVAQCPLMSVDILGTS